MPAVSARDESLDLGVKPGDVLAGKYQVERVLGAGGMGMVVAAHHIQLDTKVAIKFLLPSMLTNREAVARFAREAKSAVKITSEHVARILDVGTLDTGAPFMVMEYLEGGDLAAWLQQRGPLPTEQAVEFVLHACVAVAEAHGLGIVHRDLKPANLFCVRRPDGQLSVKVLDFGISKVTVAGRGSEPAMSVTKTSAVMGSPLYMSPEQMQSAKSADAQSDIWALGVILFELLAGRVPFDGEAATEVAVKVSMERPPSLRSFRPDVPPGLEAVILKCLEKDRQNRYRNVAELALALAEFAPKRARGSVERIANTIQAAGLSTSALAMPPSPHAAGTVVSPGTIAGVGQTAPTISGVSGRRGPVVGIAVATILVLGGAGVMVFRARGSPAAPSASGIGLAASPSPPPPESATALAPLPADSTFAASTLEAGAPPQAPALAARPSRPSSGNGGAAAPSAAAPPAAPSTVTPPAPPPATSPTAPGPSPNCDPPFTLDDQGRKHFKPECYLKQ